MGFHWWETYFGLWGIIQIQDIFFWSGFNFFLCGWDEKSNHDTKEKIQRESLLDKKLISDKELDALIINDELFNSFITNEISASMS